MARTSIKNPIPAGTLADIIAATLKAYKAADAAVPAVVKAVDNPALTSSTKFGSALVQGAKAADAKAESKVLAKLQKRQANVAANKAARAADQQSLMNLSDEAYDKKMAEKEVVSAANRNKAKNIAREEIDRIYEPQTQFEKGVPALGADLDLVSGRIDKSAKLSDETSNEFEKELLRVYEARTAEATRRAGKELTKTQKARIAKDASYDILTGSDKKLSAAESQLITRIQGGTTAKGKVVVGESQKTQKQLLQDAAVISRRQDRQLARRYGDRLISAKKNVKNLKSSDPYGTVKKGQRGYFDSEYDALRYDAYSDGVYALGKQPKGVTKKAWKAQQAEAGNNAAKEWEATYKEETGSGRLDDGFKKIQQEMKPGQKPEDMSELEWLETRKLAQDAADRKGQAAALKLRQGGEKTKGQNILEKPSGLSKEAEEAKRVKEMKQAKETRAADKARGLKIMDKQKNKLVRENTMKQYTDNEIAMMRKRSSDATEKRVGQDIDWLNKNGFKTAGLSDNEIMALRVKNEYTTSTIKGANKDLTSQKAAREKLDAQLKRGVITRKEYENLVSKLPTKVTYTGATKIPKGTVRPVKKVAKRAVGPRVKVKISDKEIAELTEFLKGKSTSVDSVSTNRLKKSADY